MLKRLFLRAAAVGNAVIALHEEWAKLPYIVVKSGCILNPRNRMAVLSFGIWHLPTSIRTTRDKEGRDSTKREYYVTQLSGRERIRQFFKEYPDYHLLVDVRGDNHQCALYITHTPDVGYNIHGFDPSNSCNCRFLCNFVVELSKRTRKIEMWSSSSDNYYGLCFSMTWHFLHEIFINNYQPLIHERVVKLLGVKSHKTTNPSEPGFEDPINSSIGCAYENGEWVVKVQRNDI